MKEKFYRSRGISSLFVTKSPKRAFFLCYYKSGRKEYFLCKQRKISKTMKERIYTMSSIKINQENLKSLIENNESVLLDFYADWCGPCRMVGPIVEEIAVENPDIAVGKINVDEEGELAAEYGVFSIPTLVVIKDGEVVSRSVGAKPKEQILALIK